MKNQAIDKNDEVHEDIIDEIEDMDNGYDSAQTLNLEVLLLSKLEYNGS